MYVRTARSTVTQGHTGGATWAVGPRGGAILQGGGLWRFE